MTVDLKAIRGRAAVGVQSNQVSESPMGAEHALDQLDKDRDDLLALVDRMRASMNRLLNETSCCTYACDCAEDEARDLLRDLDGKVP